MKYIICLFLTIVSTCFSDPNMPLWKYSKEEIAEKTLNIEYNLDLMIQRVYLGLINEECSKELYDDIKTLIFECHHEIGTESMY